MCKSVVSFPSYHCEWWVLFCSDFFPRTWIWACPNCFSSSAEAKILAPPKLQEICGRCVRMYQQSIASKWGAPKVHECLVGQFTIFNSGLGPLKAWWSLWFFEVELTSQNFILSTASLWNIVKQVPWFPVYWLVDFTPSKFNIDTKNDGFFLNVSVSPFEYGYFGYPH